MTIPETARRLLGAVLLCALGACATPEATGGGFEARDPYEQTNRAIHSFNVGLDRYALRPVAIGYDYAVPRTVKHLVGNGMSHLALPIDFANYVFQGEATEALNTLGRFTLNTLLGAGGLLDPATEFGLPREETDFGITLGRWGVESGPYIVVPLLGPSTPRDLGGFAVDRAFSPTFWLGIGGVGSIETTGAPIFVLDRVDTRARNADLIDEVLYESPDSYVTLRSIYLQRRDALVGRGGGGDLPDIFDEDDAPAE